MTHGRARMQKWSRRLGLGLVATVATVALTATTASGAFTTVHFRGHSTESGCQKNVKVAFDVLIRHGNYKFVQAFTAKNLNYPNSTPPIPSGDPTGHCIPGGIYSTYSFLDFDIFSDLHPFDPEHSRFEDQSKNVVSGTLLEEWKLQGYVTSKRRHGHIHWRAHGYLVYAQSEGGLRFPGARSTGTVYWKASATR